MSIATIVLLTILVLSQKLDTSSTINRLAMVCIVVALVLSVIANITIYFNKENKKKIWRNLMWVSIYSFGVVPLLFTTIIIGGLLFFSIIGFINDGEFKFLMVLIKIFHDPDFIPRTIICYGLLWLSGPVIIGASIGILKK